MDEVLAPRSPGKAAGRSGVSDLGLRIPDYRELTSMLNEVGDPAGATGSRGNICSGQRQCGGELPPKKPERRWKSSPKRMPHVEEVVNHIRSQERIEWLASLKPAF
jgi:hypothetical protein